MKKSILVAGIIVIFLAGAVVSAEGAKLFCKRCWGAGTTWVDCSRCDGSGRVCVKNGLFFSVWENCPKCSGKGRDYGSCPKCNGKGRYSR